MNVSKAIAALERMTVTELRMKHFEVVGEDNRSRHKEYLVKRISWRIQAQIEGGLSERAKRRALELAAESDLRTTKPKHAVPPSQFPGKVKVVTIQRNGDGRVPMPGVRVPSPLRDTASDHSH